MEIVQIGMRPLLISRWLSGHTPQNTKDDKIAIAAYYDAELKKDRTSDEVLRELAKRYDKSERQLQRYISEIKERNEAGSIFESHAELSINPPVTDPRRPNAFTIKHKEGDICSFNLKCESILIQSLQIRTSDPEVPYQLMLFECDPRKLSGRVEEEDMIQMEPITQRIYTYPHGNPLPYVNRDGGKNLHVAIFVFARNIPIDYLVGELNDERGKFLGQAVNFTLTLRYRVI